MAAALAVSPMIDSNLEVDKLTYEIFSILETKFLFGAYDDPKLFLSGKSNNSLAPPVKNHHRRGGVAGKVRILSVDGGGSTDGILAGVSLAHLEERLRSKSGDPDARVADFFDVAAGSGGGGILASLLFTRGKDGRPIMKADEALQFLMKNHRKLMTSRNSGGIFRRIFRPETSSEKLFRRAFGEATLKDTLKPVLIPCYDLATRAPFVFSRADALETDGYDFAMREVCAATVADPTVAGAAEMRSVDKRTRIAAVDGGVAMNNPTAAAITHVLNNKQEFPFCDSVEDLLVVSLGNGESATAAARRADPTMSPAAGFLKIAGEGASDMVDQAVSMAFGEMMQSNYVRIQASGFMMNNLNARDHVEMAEEMLKQRNVESVLFRGKKIVEKTNLDKLEIFAGELVKEQERRKSSILPVVVLKQASPRTSSATFSTVSSC
ncbi:hypothetical protein Syun_028182 [Stephania yunnanensis]|uniref:Patatin n=1 Tax=Stephania yunnanensis TaxID=152371 RepID=A0AAP0HQW4_9MAGN